MFKELLGRKARIGKSTHQGLKKIQITCSELQSFVCLYLFSLAGLSGKTSNRTAGSCLHLGLNLEAM